MQVEARVTVVIQSNAEHLDLVMAMVRGVCEAYLEPRGAHRLVEVAVGEACSNVVRHAHAGQPRETFTLDLRVDDADVEFVITDRGEGYDFAGRSMPVPDLERLEALPEGGFGIPLIKAIMDVAEYRREPDRNVLRLVKHRSAG